MKIYRIAQIHNLESAFSAVQDEYCKIMTEYYRVRKTIRGKGKRQSPHMSWSVIPFSRIKKIWEDYAKTGVVRDINGMDEIKYG